MAEHPVPIRFLSKTQTEALLTWSDVVEAVDAVFRSDGRGDLITPKKDPIRMDDGRSMLMAMPGYLRDMGVAGMKWMRSYPFKPDGIPQLWAQLLIISDAATGLPTGVMDATTITAMRTAGGHGVVAAKYLAKKSSRVLCVTGSGAQAKAGIQSFDAAFDLDEIRVWSPHLADKKDAFAASLGALRARLTLCGKADELYDGCDILLTTTAHRGEPLLDAKRLPAGCFVSSMTSFYEFGTQILDTADKWVLGHRLSDTLQILEDRSFAGQLPPEKVYGTLGEIAAGRLPGRESDSEILLYTHMGMGAFDVAIGQRLLEKAAAQGVGTELDLI